jgi:hypothetical protein
MPPFFFDKQRCRALCASNSLFLILCLIVVFTLYESINVATIKTAKVSKGGFVTLLDFILTELQYM